MSQAQLDKIDVLKVDINTVADPTLVYQSELHK